MYMGMSMEWDHSTAQHILCLKGRQGGGGGAGHFHAAQMRSPVLFLCTHRSLFAQKMNQGWVVPKQEGTNAQCLTKWVPPIKGGPQFLVHNEANRQPMVNQQLDSCPASTTTMKNPIQWKKLRRFGSRW